MGSDANSIKCGHRYINGEKCEEKVMSGSVYCILHSAVPADEESEEFQRILNLKEKKVNEKLNNNDFNFRGAHLYKVDFSGRQIGNNLNFIDARITKYACFDYTTIKGNVCFQRAKIHVRCALGALDEDEDFDVHSGCALSFMGASIEKDVFLNEVDINGDVNFTGAKICKFVHIVGNEIYIAQIKGRCWFNGTQIGGYPSFLHSEITAGIDLGEAKLGFDDSLVKGFRDFGSCPPGTERFIYF